MLQRAVLEQQLRPDRGELRRRGQRRPAAAAASRAPAGTTSEFSSSSTGARRLRGAGIAGAAIAVVARLHDQRQRQAVHAVHAAQQVLDLVALLRAVQHVDQLRLPQRGVAREGAELVPQEAEVAVERHDQAGDRRPAPACPCGSPPACRARP